MIDENTEIKLKSKIFFVLKIKQFLVLGKTYSVLYLVPCVNYYIFCHFPIILSNWWTQPRLNTELKNGIWGVTTNKVPVTCDHENQSINTCQWNLWITLPTEPRDTYMSLIPLHRRGRFEKLFSFQVKLNPISQPEWRSNRRYSKPTFLLCLPRTAKYRVFF